MIEFVMPMNKNKTDKKMPNPLKKTWSAQRGERDALSGGKTAGERRLLKQLSSAKAKDWYILLGLSFIISLLLFPNILPPPTRYELGDVADRDIKASHEFLVENQDLTEKNREEAAREVLSVYDFDPGASNLLTRIKEAFASGREALAASDSTASAPGKGAARPVAGKPADAGSIKTDFFEILDIPEDDKMFHMIEKSRFSNEVGEAAITLLTPVFKKGIVSDKAMLMSRIGKGIILQGIYSQKGAKVTDPDRFLDLKTAKKSIERKRKALYQSMGSRQSAIVSLKLAAALIRPNVTFNKRETELKKDLARKAVKPFYFKVKKGEMLVREGERITPRHLLKLVEQNKFFKQKEMIGRIPAMAMLIAFLISALYLVGLMKHRSGGEERALLFTAVTLLAIFLLVLASSFVAEETARGFNYFTARALLFAVPLASGAMLISVFQGVPVAASFSLIISVLASLVVGGGVEFFVYFFVSSLVAAKGVRHCRERGVFIKTGLKVGLVNMALALSIEALYGSFYSLEALIASTSAFIGGILVGVMATGILPVIEMLFGFTSDIKLLEQANLDQPLLRELMVQAPGTHHHSVIVSNMAEASAQAVNANPLLAKVAAYYHDIGKMKKPLYFIENQANRENKHEKLAPSMSSLILISHIKDGVELAKKHHMGKEIVDIIKQHHGTSLISFFYEKAKEQAARKGAKSTEVKKEAFRYPGPKPQTKEAGLIMLADAVEAASKTLVDPTSARIQGMVQKIINKVFSDGQLDECELTLKDLHEIAKSFNKTVSGIFHHRIEYPEPVARGGPAKKGGNGNTDQLPIEDPGTKDGEDKTEAPESLKRLGL
ncbi:MAG: HDIG domain-containing protein [Deltaproteobacteria bacterium]|nr:HDIG domain-containing protein [Deltaproteobacteria bacterium]